MYLYARPSSWPGSGTARAPWSHFGGLADPPKRAGTLVLYVRPSDAAGKGAKWSFEMAGAREEYEKALHKHLAKEQIVPAKGTAYEPLAGSGDIKTLAIDRYENLVLIVHSAANGPAIGVNIAGSGDWLKDDAVGKVLAPLAYDRVTILGCDAVENKFAPSLAARLPKGSTVVGHKGGAFIINKHFEVDKKNKSRAVLTHLSSNFKLKTFKGGK
jgi:hypothetical protein